MNPAATVTIAVLAAAGTSAGVSLLLSPTPAPADVAAPGVTRADLARLADDLRAELRANTAAPTAVGAGTTAERTALPAVSDAQLDAAVARWFTARGDAPLAAGTGGGAASAAAQATDPDAAFRELRGTNAWDNGAAWRKMFDSGQADAVLAAFERNAEALSTDPQAQVDLAYAYLGVMQFDQSRWQLSMKADESFDKALALDENHWEARFSKAVSYSFWPDFTGKKKEAVAHFERLVERQRTLAPSPEHADTYVFLGNLLEQRGDTERAREVWREGLARHPEHAELRTKGRD